MAQDQFHNAEWGARVYACYAKHRHDDRQDDPAYILNCLLSDLQAFAAYQGLDFNACLPAEKVRAA